MGKSQTMNETGRTNEDPKITAAIDQAAGITWKKIDRDIRFLIWHTLSLPQWEAWVLHLAGLSQHRAAAMLGISRATLRSRRDQAHRKLDRAGVRQDRYGRFALGEPVIEESVSGGPMFVYFARLGPLVKVGISLNPARRVSDLNAELLHFAEGGRDMERLIHLSFSDVRVRGEWFLPDERMEKFIAAAIAGQSWAELLPTPAAAVSSPQGGVTADQGEWRGEKHRILPRHFKSVQQIKADQSPAPRTSSPLESRQAHARGIPIIGAGCGSGASPGTDPLGALLSSLPNE